MLIAVLSGASAIFGIILLVFTVELTHRENLRIRKQNQEIINLLLEYYGG